METWYFDIPIYRSSLDRQSYGISTRSSDAVSAFLTSRVVSRAALAAPRDEIGRVIALLERGGSQLADEEHRPKGLRQALEGKEL